MFLLKRISVLACLLAVAVSGCNLLGRPQTPQNRPAPTIRSKVSKTLLYLFPQRIRTRWNYQGTGGYSQTMILQKNFANKQRSKITHQLVGKVAPTPGGKDTPLALEYIFDSREIRQRLIESGHPFPERISNLILIRLPLKTGQSWEQQVRLEGEDRTLRAEITAIDPMRNGNTRYTVRYRVPMNGMPEGKYEEIREFQAGMGVTRYQNNAGSPPGSKFEYAVVQLEPPDQPIIYDRVKKPKLP